MENREGHVCKAAIEKKRQKKKEKKKVIGNSELSDLRRMTQRLVFDEDSLNNFLQANVEWKRKQKRTLLRERCV